MTTNKTQFKKGLESLKKLSMTPREKGEVFHKLYLYTEAHPAVSTATFYAAFLKLVKVFLPIE